MGAGRTYAANRYSTELAAAMGPTDLNALVLTTAAGPQAPCYLVIDHDVPAKTEIVLFDGTTDGTTWRCTALAKRYQSGSTAPSGITHDAAAKVISSPLGSIINDLWDELATAGVPLGGIIMWSGSIAQVPTGFRLCDGTFGTPDLRNRFVLGAGSTGYQSPGGTGGATNHSHAISGSTASDSHNHSFSGSTSSDTHSHGVKSESAKPADATSKIVGADADTFSDTHGHSVSGTTGSDSHSHSITSGTAGSIDARPPWYALAFIQRAS